MAQTEINLSFFSSSLVFFFLLSYFFFFFPVFEDLLTPRKAFTFLSLDYDVPRDFRNDV